MKRLALFRGQRQCFTLSFKRASTTMKAGLLDHHHEGNEESNSSSCGVQGLQMTNKFLSLHPLKKQQKGLSSSQRRFIFDSASRIAKYVVEEHSNNKTQIREYHSRNGKRSASFSDSSSQGDSTIDTLEMDFSKTTPISLNSSSISHKWNVVEFDDQGNITMSQIKRSDLYSNYGLQGRDIRILVSNMNYPSILPRSQCIIVSISNISAIITHEKLYLLKSDYTNNLDPTFIKFIQQFLIYYAKSKEVNKYSFDETPYGFFEQSYALPFEFRILECILHKVCATIEKDKNEIQERVNDILAAPDYTSEEVLYQILQTKQKLTRFKTFVNELHETIESILQQDDDMATMYLSEKVTNGQPREIDKHEEIEMLLETYQNRVENVINSIDDMREDLDDTQEFLEVCLDSIRNKMMQMELQLAIAAFSLTFGTLMAGVFGMNLLSHFEDHPYAFYYTSGLIALSTLFLFFVTLLVCKRKGIFKSTYVTEKRKELRQVITSKFGSTTGDN